MSAIQPRLLLIFRASPSQTQLDELREALDLRRRGRLTDLEDELFGTRDISIADVPAEMTLWRNDHGLWSIDISADPDAVLAESDIADWQSAVEAAVTDAGWTFVERRSFPGRRP